MIKEVLPTKQHYSAIHAQKIKHDGEWIEGTPKSNQGVDMQLKLKRQYVHHLTLFQTLHPYLRCQETLCGIATSYMDRQKCVSRVQHKKTYMWLVTQWNSLDVACCRMPYSKHFLFEFQALPPQRKKPTHKTRPAQLPPAHPLSIGEDRNGPGGGLEPTDGNTLPCDG